MKGVDRSEVAITKNTDTMDTDSSSKNGKGASSTSRPESRGGGWGSCDKSGCQDDRQALKELQLQSEYKDNRIEYMSEQLQIYEKDERLLVERIGQQTSTLDEISMALDSRLEQLGGDPVSIRGLMEVYVSDPQELKVQMLGTTLQDHEQKIKYLHKTVNQLLMRQDRQDEKHREAMVNGQLRIQRLQATIHQGRDPASNEADSPRTTEDSVEVQLAESQKDIMALEIKLLQERTQIRRLEHKITTQQKQMDESKVEALKIEDQKNAQIEMLEQQALDQLLYSRKRSEVLVNEPIDGTVQAQLDFLRNATFSLDRKMGQLDEDIALLIESDMAVLQTETINAMVQEEAEEKAEGLFMSEIEKLDAENRRLTTINRSYKLVMQRNENNARKLAIQTVPPKTDSASRKRRASVPTRSLFEDMGMLNSIPKFTKAFNGIPSHLQTKFADTNPNYKSVGIQTVPLHPESTEGQIDEAWTQVDNACIRALELLGGESIPGISCTFSEELEFHMDKYFPADKFGSLPDVITSLHQTDQAAKDYIENVKAKFIVAQQGYNEFIAGRLGFASQFYTRAHIEGARGVRDLMPDPSNPLTDTQSKEILAKFENLLLGIVSGKMEYANSWLVQFIIKRYVKANDGRRWFDIVKGLVDKSNRLIDYVEELNGEKRVLEEKLVLERENSEIARKEAEQGKEDWISLEVLTVNYNRLQTEYNQLLREVIAAGY